MNRSRLVALFVALLPLSLAEPARAGVVTHLTFATKAEGNTTAFQSNVGLTPDSNGNLLSGQEVTVDSIAVTLSAIGGRNLAGTLLNPQRLHLSNSGLGVRGGGGGSLHAGESLVFQSETLLTLTELVFIRPVGSQEDPFSFDLLVDDTPLVTSLSSQTSTLNRFEFLERFTFNVTGNSFAIRTTGGEARLAQLSVMANTDPLAGVVAVPEPSTLALAACGAVIGLFCYGRSRSRPGRNRAEA